MLTLVPRIVQREVRLSGLIRDVENFFAQQARVIDFEGMIGIEGWVRVHGWDNVSLARFSKDEEIA